MGVRARAAFFRLFAYVLFVGVFVVFALGLDTPVRAAPGINEQINFQGRLLNAQGATVPDGFYNIEFKIYQDGTGLVAGNPGGTLEWTESHLNDNSEGVQVKNGFLSVQLGAITPFGSLVDWNQDTLWLSINIGNTNTTCNPFSACSPDNEMLPMKRLASTPYALNAGRLNGLTGGQFVQLAQGVQTDASSGPSSIAINKTGTGNMLEFQNNGNAAFLLNNSGDAVFGGGANHSISVATAGASVAGKSLSVVAGGAGTGAAVNGGDLFLQGGTASGTGTSGSVIVKSNGSNSATAFQVQNAAGTTTVLDVDTTNTRVGIGTSAPTRTLDIAIDNSSVNTLTALLRQNGSGDVGLELATGGQNYYMGIDNTDDKFKISSGTASGGLVKLGNGDDTGTTTDSGSSNAIHATKFTASATGTISKLYAYVANPVSAGPNNQAQMGIYADNGSGTAPGSLLTNSSSITLTGDAWNEFSIASTSVTSGTIYWLAYNSNGTNDSNNNLRYDAGSSGQSVWNDPETFGTWNGTWPGTDGNAAVAYTMYANISASSGTDNFSTRLFEMDATGNTIFQNSANSATAFQVQNATNTAILSVNTSNSGVLVAGLLDTITATTLAVGTNNATAINLNKNTAVSGSNTFTVGTGLTLLGGDLDVTGSAAFKKGSDFSNAGTTHNADFGEASYIRLTGVSAQTITGIADGRDGEILTITNAGSQAAFLMNNNNGSLAANRIITGSGVDLTLLAGASVTLIYDTTGSLWRATGGAAGVTTVGAIDSQTKSANGAVIAGTSIYLQTADATNVGLVSTSAQTIAGAKTFNSLLTGQAGATVSGGAISLTGNAASSLTTSSGALTLTSAAATTWSTAAGDLTLQAGSGTVSLGSSGTLTNTGALAVTGGTTLTLSSTGANNVSINTGSTAAINVGTSNASTVHIGNTSLGAGTQAINIGNNNTSGGTTNITIGAGGSATGGTTTLQAKGDITINTNGVTRATFDDGGTSALYLGNGLTAAAPNDFLVSGTGSATTAVAGGSLTIQGGNATVGTAHGGNLTLRGGTGVGGSGAKGLVMIDTPTMTTAGTQSCGSNCNITQANIDSNAAVLINATAAGLIITLSDPTITTAGRVIYVTNFGANDFTLAVNGGVGATNTVTLKPNTTATMIWNGNDWTAAGASSSTDLQAAYNNTASSAGAAELVLKNTSTSNGLTVRNGTGSDEIIGGGLFEVQTSIGSNLFSVNNNATEYANNGGGESSTFTMWTAAPAGGSVSRFTTAGNNIATGVASVLVDTTSTANTGVRNTLSSALTANLKYRVSYAVRHTSSTSSFTTLDTIFSRDGTNTSTTDCATGSTATFGQWTRISCTFTAPSSGITSSNAIFIRHSDSVEHDFYVDNLSVTVSADVNHAADGSVDLALGSNWTAYDADGGAGTSTVSLENSIIYDTSGSVQDDVTNNANLGMRNNMSITPQFSTQYLVSFYARSSTTFTNITVGFLPAGGSGTPNSAQLCTDYNTQSVSTSGWTKITCLFTTPSSGITDPDLVIYQPTAPGAIRTFYVDALSITLNTNNASNVQIGGGNKGGPPTLFTLDRSNGAPIANNNDVYLGSMYYDTSSGRIQCYEADGWGACGAAPDNIVNLNPEYAGAVLNGGGVGTMTADFCSNDSALTVNSTLCSTGQAKNFYRWTSPQATEQSYSIYVTYQLPATFNGFSSDDTVQLVARVDDTTDASVTYEMFKSTGSAVTQCGSGETNIITGGGGAADTWYSYGINGNEATGCSFNSSSAGNLIIFKINLKAKANANAYVSTLTFTTTGR